MHQIKAVVDLVQAEFMGDHRVYFDLAVHIPIDNFGTSVRPDAPANAVPRHTRPVTSWNGRVLISAPAGATPMMMLSPQPLWAASRAVRITDTFPVASKV